MDNESATPQVDIRTSLAIQNGAVSVVDGVAMYNEGGAPLSMASGSNQLLVVAAPPTCTHHGIRAVKPTTGDEKVRVQFDTNEHMSIVDGLFLQLPSGQYAASTKYLGLAPGFQLTYGQVIALAGDFYGDPDRPICMAGSRAAQIEQFNKNFQSLKSSAGEATNILQIAYKYEYAPIQNAIRHGATPSSVYMGIPQTQSPIMNDEDLAFDTATGGGGPGSPDFGRYSWLALKNLDHFGVDAIAAYLAGHILAQQTAAHANGSPDANTMMMTAHAMDAFACHFLTDLFGLFTLGVGAGRVLRQ